MSLGSSVVERSPEEAGVASSILAPGTRELYRASTVLTDFRLGGKSEEAGVASSILAPGTKAR